jgi:hypothetical protein
MKSQTTVRESKETAGWWSIARLVVIVHLVWLSLFLGLSVVPHSSMAADAVEFPGTVVSVDAAASKFAVKKDSGGTRFTFVTNDKTIFEGGPKGVDDLKKDDHIVVLYRVQGSQYVAQKVIKGK